VDEKRWEGTRTTKAIGFHSEATQGGSAYEEDDKWTAKATGRRLCT